MQILVTIVHILRVGSMKRVVVLVVQRSTTKCSSNMKTMSHRLRFNKMATVIQA